MGEIKIIKQAIHHNVWFWVLLITSIGLIIASFLVPPTGVIDGSVLAAVGELAGFGALGALLKAMDMGVDARVRHKDTEVTVGDLNKYPSNPNNYNPDEMIGEDNE